MRSVISSLLGMSLCAPWSGLYGFLSSPFFCAGLAMADQNAHEEQPRRSSSMEKKRPSGDDEKGDKRRKGGPSQACSLRDSPMPADGDMGCSGLGNKSSECGTASSSDKLDKLTSLLSGLIEKLDNKAQGPPTSDAPDYGGFHDLSSSDEDCVVAKGVTYDTDPLDNLDTFSPAQPSLQADVDEASFLRALDEFSDCFHDEPKGDSLSERLASILNVSLRRRPNSDDYMQSFESA